ncbi:hypothetical protein C7974DRAFT_111765 [Boeremia exigua]|uniref:uncharacterized protein n=1 Tax=Boeremia exigua TaxID=749465 RepID=UPI001E8E27DD|nr:uncharacterized protein C7974DRAFT_111765 [Boeremia exigua]KAH6642849.1 hypothetical protein C7974DRAFT_111765 [Boeremia exigua]
MSILKTLVPVLLILGFLQAGVLALPIVYVRFQVYLNFYERYLFIAALLFIAFVIHPLLIIGLITFTVAPPLLSLRHTISDRLSTAYIALTPSALSSAPFLDKGLPTTGKEWLMTLLGSYVGWKTLGTVPSLMILLVFLALYSGREDADERRGWIAKGGLRGGKEVEKVTETGLGVRSERTDVQTVG